jgi:hypothetical protein
MLDLDTSCGYNLSSVKLMNPFKGSLFEREGCEVLVEVWRHDPQAPRRIPVEQRNDLGRSDASGDRSTARAIVRF